MFNVGQILNSINILTKHRYRIWIFFTIHLTKCIKEVQICNRFLRCYGDTDTRYKCIDRCASPIHLSRYGPTLHSRYIYRDTTQHCTHQKHLDERLPVIVEFSQPHFLRKLSKDKRLCVIDNVFMSALQDVLQVLLRCVIN